MKEKLESLQDDLAYNLRGLRRSPGATAAVLLILALGIGANTALFSVLHSVLWRPLPYPESDRLVRLRDRVESRDMSPSVTSFNFLEWRKRNRVFEQVGAYRENGFNLILGDQAERVEGARVTASLLRVLGVQPSLGRNFTEEEDSPGAGRSVILSHRLWQSRFGADRRLGTTLSVDGEPFSVVGVLPAGFVFPQQPQVDLLTPFGLRPEPTSHYLRVLARLKPRVSLAEARADMTAVAAQLEAESPPNVGWSCAIETLHEEMVGDVRGALWLSMAAVGLVLLLACADVAHLLYARSLARRNEIGIRLALGASRGRLLRLMLGESLLLSTAGGALGLLVAVWTVDALQATSLSFLPRREELAVRSTAFGFALLLSLSTGVASGLLPAFSQTRAAGRWLAEAPGKGAVGRRSTPGLLLASEAALAVIVLVGAGLLIRSFASLVRIDPGFARESVLSFDLSVAPGAYPDPARRAGLFRDLLQRFAEVPGVEAAGAVHRLPLEGGSSFSPYLVEGRPEPRPEEVPVVSYRSVSPGYFEALAIPILRGRSFTEREAWETGGAAMVNQALARKLWPEDEAVGKRIRTGLKRPWLEVVGVAADVRESELEVEAEPALYLPYIVWPVPAMKLVARSSGPPLALAGALKQQVAEVDPAQPVSGFRTVEAIVDQTVAQPRFNAGLMSLLAAVALLLAGAGVHGVVSHAVALRTREIGIRMALGAQIRDVLYLVLRQGLLPVGVGMAVGAMGALGLARLLRGLVFGVGLADPLTFAAAPLVLGVVAAAAALLPAARASRIDPLAALRWE